MGELRIGKCLERQHDVFGFHHVVIAMSKYDQCRGSTKVISESVGCPNIISYNSLSYWKVTPVARVVLLSTTMLALAPMLILVTERKLTKSNMEDSLVSDHHSNMFHYFL